MRLLRSASVSSFRVVFLLLIICLFGSAALGQYCSASGGCSEVIAESLNIDSVEVGGISNTGTGCDGYFDYTSMSTTMEIGAGYAITVTNGDPFDASDQCGIWVDWNQDHDFYDAGEAISVSGGSVIFTTTITPPGGASLGATRMRIRIRWAGTLDPCGDTDWGEVEDYTINVAPVVPPGYGGGTGEPNDPYQIKTAAQMNAIGADPCDWDKHFLLCDNIDLSAYTGTSFNIIGDYDNPFTGVFDGNNHTISNFSYTVTGRDDIGLFGYIREKDALIKDLGLVNPNVSVVASNEWNARYIGSLVGGVWDGGRISGCFVEGGSVSGREHVGGLAGEVSRGTVVNCYSSSAVSATHYVAGGLVGGSQAKISNCYSTGSVSGSWGVGGLVGSNGSIGSGSGGGAISNCYSTGSVSGVQNVGGLAGVNFYSTIRNCYSTGSVTGVTEVGGLVGNNQGPVISSFWDKQSSGQSSSEGGTGKTTAEMQMGSTFIGWNGCGELFWTIDEGNDYPRLGLENKPGELLPVQQLSDFVAGAGTESDPYLIYTGEELNLIGLFYCEWDKHFKLMADINLAAYTGTSFNIIGIRVIRAYCFTGTFDGNGHIISNFSYTTTGGYEIGLFGAVDGPGAEIKDLGLINPEVDAGTGRWVGSLVGWFGGDTITDCYVDGAGVSGMQNVGGLVGYNHGGTISNCYSTGNVSGDEYVGGLVGSGGTITNCYSTSSVSGDWVVGGLVGYNMPEGTVTNCYSTGGVLGGGAVGGLVGYNWGGTVSVSFWDKQTSVRTNMCGSQGAGGSGCDDGNGKTTDEMQTESTFTSYGWDFVDEIDNGTEDIWRLCVDGIHYPKLWWQFTPGDFTCPDGVDGIDLGVLCGEWLFEELSADVWPEGGDGFVDFLDWAIFADGWGVTVDYDDLAGFAEQWLKTGSNYYIADIAPPPDGDGIVNGLDFAVLAEEWLAGL